MQSDVSVSSVQDGTHKDARFIGNSSESTFTRQKIWVRTRQKRSPYLTFLSDPCKLRISCFFEMGTKTSFWGRGFGVIDVYAPSP